MLWLVAAMMAFGLNGTARAQIPTDEPAFTAFVAGRIRAEIHDTPVVIKGPLTLSIGPLQANLDRIYAFCKANTAGCAEQIKTYVDAVVATTRNQDERPTKASLRVVVRPSDYIAQAQREIQARDAILMRPLAEGLAVVLVMDFPRTTRMFNEKHRAALGLTADQAFDVAFANLRQSLKPLEAEAKAVKPGQIGTLRGDYYQSSRLALIDSWAPLAQAQGGVLIVAAPSAEVVLYIGEDSPAARDALRTLAKNIMRQAPKPLSDVLLRWTPKGWQRVQ
jgi:uncharacterized protein YtpQ (UPF0354 family)